MKILAISGSLRAASINSALLRAIVRSAPDGMNIEIFQRLGELPLFNPDLEIKIPTAVDDFRCRVAVADAILIASPEYAHGVTGAMKNALDWLVGYESFFQKTVAILNTSPRAQHADAALREILKTMAANIIESASVSIPLLGAGLDENGMLQTPSVVEAIRKTLSSLNEAVTFRRPSQSASFPVQ